MRLQTRTSCVFSDRIDMIYRFVLPLKTIYFAKKYTNIKYQILIFVSCLFLYSCSNSNAGSMGLMKPVIIMDSISHKDTNLIEKQKDSILIVEEFTFTKDELMGRVKPTADTDFIRIEKKYTSKSKIYMRKEAYESYCEMYAAAKLKGFDLKIISAFRSNYHQRLIWEAKWSGKRKVNGKLLNPKVENAYERAKLILQFSSMPGSSRHHWGTDIDIYSLENSSFETGKGIELYKWLQSNASTYGFCQVYTADRSQGYNEEKWHWSYTPISKQMIKAYQKQISISDFKGFLGSETADSVHIIKEYVFGIGEGCF